ncbi:MAG: hypothetical protein ABI833_00090 [Acidobacteriota bacterium]
MKLENSEPLVRINLLRPVTAVKLQDHPGSSLRNPTEVLIEVPPGASVEIEGPAAPSGLCTILWNGDAYSVFYEELRENGRHLDSLT